MESDCTRLVTVGVNAFESVLQTNQPDHLTYGALCQTNPARTLHLVPNRNRLRLLDAALPGANQLNGGSTECECVGCDAILLDGTLQDVVLLETATGTKDLGTRYTVGRTTQWSLARPLEEHPQGVPVIGVTGDC